MTTNPTDHGVASEALRWLVGASLLGLLAWAPHSPALYYALCFDAPVTYAEADLDTDGHVSVREAGYACNVDTRPVRQDGRTCIEFFSRADWRPIKTVCD